MYCEIENNLKSFCKQLARDKQQQINQFQNALIPSIETIYFHIQF